MNKKIKLLSGFVKEGSAEFNRLLAYAHGLAYHGWNVEIVSFRVMEIEHEFEGVNIRGLWITKIGCKYLRYPLSYVCLIFYLLFSIKKDEELLLYSNGEYLPIFIFFRKGNVWHEMTESPEIIGRQCNNLRYYYKCCTKIRGVFVISRPLKELYIANGVHPDKIQIINMIADSNRFDGITKTEEDVKYIGYCGNVYSDEKDGVSDLLRIFAEYHRSYQDRYLYIVGKIVSEKQKRKYEDYLITNNLSKYVRFCGMISPKDIPKFLSNAEMLMLTRPDNKQALYGFPTKLGEYLLSKRPVIVSNVGDIGVYLSDKHNALVVPPGNDAEFVMRMKWVSDNPNAANELGIKGRECALANFNNIKETAKIVKSVNSFRIK